MVPAAPQQVAVQGELPAANAVPVEQQAELAQYAPVATPAPAPAQSYARAPESFATAFAPVAAPAPTDAVHFNGQGAQVSFVSRPVVQAIPANYSEHRLAARPVRATVAYRTATPTAARAITTGSSHLVQMGSFRSQQGARRAWGIYAARNPELKNFKMTITPAVVRGKNYWRVAAAGFDAGGAQGMCSNLKARGGVCFAYAGGAMRSAPQAAPARPAMARAQTAPARVAAKR